MPGCCEYVCYMFPTTLPWQPGENRLCGRGFDRLKIWYQGWRLGLLAFFSDHCCVLLCVGLKGDVNNECTLVWYGLSVQAEYFWSEVTTAKKLPCGCSEILAKYPSLSFSSINEVSSSGNSQDSMGWLVLSADSNAGQSSYSTNTSPPGIYQSGPLCLC